MLRAFLSRDGAWRIKTAPDQVNPRYLAMLRAYEDKRFDRHMGVDPSALLRAAWQLARAGHIVSGGSTLTMQVARDDRFIAAFDIGERYRPMNRKGPEPTPSFRIAYIARAVSVGRFALPAAHAEDMYAPAIRARTTMGQLNVNQ